MPQIKHKVSKCALEVQLSESEHSSDDYTEVQETVPSNDAFASWSPAIPTPISLKLGHPNVELPPAFQEVSPTMPKPLPSLRGF